MAFEWADDDEDEDEDSEGCDACYGIEELMVERALEYRAEGLSPHHEMGYIFGFTDSCEMCGSSFNTSAAWEAYETGEAPG